MITVLVRVSHGPEALVGTLSALVPAVAAGLVADAVILASVQNGTIAKVAEAAGATFVLAPEESWSEGARLARHDWLLCLQDGDLPQEGWIRILDRFVSLAGDRTDRARLRRRQGIARAGLDAVRRLLAPSAIRAGDLVHRNVALGERKAAASVRLPAEIERDRVIARDTNR